MAFMMKHLDMIEVAVSNFDAGNHPCKYLYMCERDGNVTKCVSVLF
jgi:hypothetical protein